jgi:CBS domain-containing protein
MATMRAREVMTAGPACCLPDTSLDEVARLMVHHDCGEIPVIDRTGRVVGVITDRDIVCRVVAEGKNPSAYTAATCMSQPVVSVGVDSPVDQVVSVMEGHRIRRVPVVDADGGCAGIIAQADIARYSESDTTGELVRAVSTSPAFGAPGFRPDDLSPR